MKQITLAVVLWIAFGSAAFAQVDCAMFGPHPNSVDPSLVPKIIAWVGRVERYLHLKPPATKAEALKLQAIDANWLDAAQHGSVDAIFREAVGHGINVQYEMLMIELDPSNAKKHQFWVDTEAARANACLDLLRLK